MFSPLSLYAFIILLFVLLSSFYSSHSFQSKCVPILLYLIFSGCIVDSNSDHTRAVNLDIKVFSSLDGLDWGVGWLKKLMTQGGGAERWPARSVDKCGIVVAHPDYGTDTFKSRWSTSPFKNWVGRTLFLPALSQYIRVCHWSKDQRNTNDSGKKWSEDNGKPPEFKAFYSQALFPWDGFEVHYL